MRTTACTDGAAAAPLRSGTNWRKWLTGLCAIIFAVSTMFLAMTASAQADTDRSHTIYLYTDAATVPSWVLETRLRDFQAALDRFNRDWHTPYTTLSTAAPPSSRSVVISVTDQLNCMGCDGYHGLTNSRVPFATVGLHNYWTTTLTHELFELAADPYLGRTIKSAGREWLVEVCDPVEGNHANVRFGGTLVSDWVTPAFYHPGWRGPYDYGRHVKRPLQVLHHGYLSWWNGVRWLQIVR